MDPISVRDIKADGNARIHVGNSSVTHVHTYAEGQALPESTPTPYSLIPFSRDLDFVTRGNILNQIAQRCSQPGGRAALVGLGGVGKSQLAIEYAYQITETSKDGWVFWVHAGSRARVEEGFRAIADAIKLPDRHQPKADIPQLLHTWLSNEKNGKWLMILDSADDHEVFYTAETGSGRQPLASYLPQSLNGSILLTTRDHGFAFRLTGKYENVIKVGPMEPAEAFTFLEKKLGVLPEPEVGEELVRALDCIPLAINQAASYIQARAPRCTIRKYLVEFQESDKKSVKLMAHDSAELRRDGSASNAIMKTWQISFDHIRSKQPSAADLLSLMSFFDYQSIPEAALNPEDDYDSDFDSDLESNGDGDELANQFSALHLVAAKTRRDHTPDNSDFDSDSDTEDSFEDDIAMLRNFCLISVNEAGTEFEMHRLVQLATKKWLAATKQNERFKQLFIHRVSISMPPPDTYKIVNFRDIVVHMQIAASYRPNRTNTRAWCTICYRLAWLRYYKGQFNGATEPIQKALMMWKERKGPEHANYLSYRRLLADILLDQDQIFESEGILNEILDVQRKTVGEKNDSTLSTMNSLAENYVRQGRYDEAEKLELQAVNIAREYLGPGDHDTLTYMACLSRTYAKQGRLEEAEAIDLIALETGKRAFGPTHPETLELMTVLASTYQVQERYDESLELELKVLDIAKAAERPNNFLIAQCMSRTSYLYRMKDMYPEAEDMIKGALELSTAELGPNHEATLEYMTDLALGYQDQGLEDEATTILLQILSRAESEHGPNHMATVSCMDSAAMLFFRQCKYAKASELQAAILSHRKTVLGLAHLDTIEAMRSLGRSYEQLSRFEDALELYKEAFSTLEKQFGFEHEETLQMASRVTTVYVCYLDRHAEAMELLEKIAAANEVKHGPDNAATLQALLALADSKRQDGLLEDAEKLQRRILESRTTVLGRLHPRTLEVITNLAETLQEREQFPEAERLLEEAILGYSSYPKGRNQMLPLVTQNLGKVYLAQNHFGEALQTLTKAFELSESRSPADHESAATSLFWKARVYSRQKLWRQAVQVQSQAFERGKAFLGPDDRRTLADMRVLAIDLDRAGDYDKSYDMLLECLDMLRAKMGPDDPDTLLVEQLLAELDTADENDDDDDNAKDEEHHTPEKSDSGTCDAPSLLGSLASGDQFAVPGECEHGTRKMDF
ncbi:hypothetical protein NLG97_g3008 [Lecanicillium saksenae]|uniref:Uncharacterized protein n=1 Tax=Lecanicillium saksenae TaxID=468837 RepID=A0ACC1QZD8_9HYPO|nr:hypothetical protein NLG97_g3008 [Lecanicillium saksenae]